MNFKVITQCGKYTAYGIEVNRERSPVYVGFFFLAVPTPLPGVCACVYFCFNLSCRKKLKHFGALKVVIFS